MQFYLSVAPSSYFPGPSTLTEASETSFWIFFAFPAELRLLPWLQKISSTIMELASTGQSWVLPRVSILSPEKGACLRPHSQRPYSLISCLTVKRKRDRRSGRKLPFAWSAVGEECRKSPTPTHPS